VVNDVGFPLQNQILCTVAQVLDFNLHLYCHDMHYVQYASERITFSFILCYSTRKML